eukprot:CAMPEP_0119551042 /NCGR_PEP_ID=MMETSP1352-20130426/4429_1 /TAXON_ID=265584 /ORGANISM="Stauroneis constricta, Strain CCMP1120" /LENGTH=65 /DNA_ID=CAMNT_0007597049 /DNA_START=397 /DNA_END=594 /DNA_ORIENTATION=-
MTNPQNNQAQSKDNSNNNSWNEPSSTYSNAVKPMEAKPKKYNDPSLASVINSFPFENEAERRYSQ